MVTNDRKQQVIDLIQTAEADEIEAIYEFLQPEEIYTPDFKQELYRRLAAIDSGEAKLSTWEEVKERLIKRYQEKHG